MKTQHTPGPWKIKTKPCAPVWADSGDKFWRIPVVGVIYGATLEQELANARLIAAAPELLEACVALLEVAGDDWSDNYEAAKGLALAAIQKAKGK